MFNTWPGRVAAAAAIVLVLLLLLLLSYCGHGPQWFQHLTTREEQTALTPYASDANRILALDDVVVAGFSGTTILTAEFAPLPTGARAVAQTFIDINGPAARILNPGAPALVWNGNMLAAAQIRAVRAGDVGQVFGIAIDDAAHPNIYLAATSVYGLNLVAKPPRDDDDDDKGKTDDDDVVPLRLHTGSSEATWMAGQFGPGGGPSSIWRVDGHTGKVSLFTTITLNGEADGPAALGNLAYDGGHRQIFVSDLSTGMIHRLDLAGHDLGHFDHGVAGRRAAGLDPIAFSSSSLARITDPHFNPENPGTWGFAPAARRVWGLSVHDKRLYYAVADGHIWSVGLKDDGDFGGDARKEIDLPAGAAPVSDIVFSHEGAMIVAQRAVIGTHFNYRPLEATGAPHVWRFWPEQPDDLSTSSTWYQQPEEYAVGFAGNNRNSGGGVDLAYGYKIDDKGHTTFDFDACEDAIVFTGSNLRTFHNTQVGFDPEGPLELNGLQISPSRPVRGFNTPPMISYFVNYRDTMDSDDHSGSLGGVRVYRLACNGICPMPREEDAAVNSGPRTASVVPPPLSPPGTSNPPNPPNSGDCTGPGCIPPCTGTDCSTPCTGADCPTPCTGPDCPCTGDGCGHKTCMAIKGQAVCDPASGGWVYKLTATDPLGLGIDSVGAYSRIPGVTVANGPQISLLPPPGVIQLSGASPGQHVTIDVCGFNSSDPNYKAGKPYDCCRETLHVRVPHGICKARIEQ